MTKGDELQNEHADELRKQEVEFYEAVMAVLAAMPPGSNVSDALVQRREPACAPS